jgi:transposase InsO family protein
MEQIRGFLSGRESDQGLHEGPPNEANQHPGSPNNSSEGSSSSYEGEESLAEISYATGQMPLSPKKAGNIGGNTDIESYYSTAGNEDANSECSSSESETDSEHTISEMVSKPTLIKGVDKYDGKTSYDEWRRQLMSTLKVHRVDKIATGDATRADATDKDMWDIDDFRIQNCILRSIDPAVAKYAKGDTALELLKALEKQYWTLTRSQAQTLWMSLGKTKLSASTAIEPQLTDLMLEVDRLDGTKYKLCEEMRVMLILDRLPRQFSQMRIAVMNRVDDTGVDDLIQEAKAHQERLATEGTLSLNSIIRDNAFHVTESTNPKRFKGKCFNCGKPGHRKAECRQSRRPKPKQYHSSSNVEECMFLSESSTTLAPGMRAKEWIVDSGASSHMCNDRTIFHDLEECNQQVQTAGNAKATAEGAGIVSLTVHERGKSKMITLRDVLYVPTLRSNLISVGKLMQSGAVVDFSKKGCSVRKGKRTAFTAQFQPDRQLYILHPSRNCGYVADATPGPKSLVNKRWHERLGHLSFHQMKQLEKVSTGMVLEQNEFPFCPDCATSKSTRLPLGGCDTRAMEIGDRISSDLQGPITPMTLGGAKYHQTIIDHGSRMIFSEFPKSKGEAEDNIKKFVEMMKNRFNIYIKTLRTDGGGEFTSNEFENWLESRGIHHEKTNAHTPEQNGVCEKLQHVLTQMAKTMLSSSKLPKNMWAEAMATATTIKNMSPSTYLQGKTPFEVWHKREPNLAKVRTFGCAAYVHVPKCQRTKLQKEAVAGRFIGFARNQPGFKVLLPSGKIIVSKDVRFDENDLQSISNANQSESESESEDDPNQIQTETTVNGNVQIEETVDQHVIIDEPEQRRSSRQATQERVDYHKLHHGKLCEEFAGNTSTLPHAENIIEPENIFEALNGEFAKKWKDAAEDELKSLDSNEVWDLVDLPTGRTPIGSKWVLKIKRKSDGTIDRFKARLVAQGYAQQYGIDYEQTFSPVARLSTVRTLISYATQRNLKIYQMDVKTAYLNGILEEEVYMKQPPGFEKGSKVCKLKKSLYGLKQSGRCWYQNLNDHLLARGFVTGDADSCLYILKQGNDIDIICIYVDDILILSSNSANASAIKTWLNTNYEMKDLGELHYFLGIKIDRDINAGYSILSQENYAREVLTRFGMIDCKPVATPLENNVKFTGVIAGILDENSEIDRKFPYRQAIGALMYLSVCTRPDLATAISILSKFNANPQPEHWQAVKRVFRYLKGTMGLGILYSNEPNQNQACINGDPIKHHLFGYADASWADDLQDRRSTTGYVFMFNNAPISWCCRRQSTVALSSTEAEYMALADATQEALWILKLMKDLEYQDAVPLNIYEDNQGCIAIAHDPTMHKRTKHIDTKHHFLRQHIQERTITLNYCETNLMLADFMTKPLARPKFEDLRRRMNIINLSTWNHDSISRKGIGNITAKLISDDTESFKTGTGNQLP